VAAYQEDLKKYQETAPGRIEKTTAAWEDFVNKTGKTLIPTLANFASVLYNFIPALEKYQKSNFNL